MAQVSKYSLWLQRISGNRQAAQPGGIEVFGFSFSQSRVPALAGGGGHGKAHFNLIDFIAVDSNLASIQLFHAQHSGVTVGRGRLEAISCGTRWLLLEFEDAFVESVTPTASSTNASHFSFQLSINRLRILAPSTAKCA